MKLIMTGLDHKLADLVIREKFAVTKEKTKSILAAVQNSGMVEGCVILSTCNRTELYASIPANSGFLPSQTLCAALGRDYIFYKNYLIERVEEQAMEHLCHVASGLDSQIRGDDQIITQVREALELSRAQCCADSCIETMFRLAIQAAKIIKTNLISSSMGTSSVPGKTVDKLKTLYPLLAGKNAVVIGNGWMGRLISELLINENVNVKVTMRKYKNGAMQIPKCADAINYDERYKAIEAADMVISATSSPHFTLFFKDLSTLPRLPGIIVDLAVPRDVDPAVQAISGVTLLTIDDISEGSRCLPLETTLMIEKIITEHKKKYTKWLMIKETKQIAAGDRV
ncbi:MAG: hypothetical protein FWG07_09985 [Treponema sp.]|nr:hypothetical protein [Treponema sp.]